MPKISGLGLDLNDNYEHIPFHCRKCHEHGHLFQDHTLNDPPKVDVPTNDKNRMDLLRCRVKRNHSTKTPMKD